jgi:hypothetical protein
MPGYMNHIHHITPKSRGGTDNPENLQELDFKEHAYLHAIDFLNGGPRFDFRHAGWPLLEEELRKKVLEKASEHSQTLSGWGMATFTFEQKSKAGKKGGPIGAKNQPREVRVANGKKGVQTRIERYGTPSPTQRYRCPCCGLESTAGPITKHINSTSNLCIGEKQPLNQQRKSE